MQSVIVEQTKTNCEGKSGTRVHKTQATMQWESQQLTNLPPFEAVVGDLRHEGSADINLNVNAGFDRLGYPIGPTGEAASPSISEIAEQRIDSHSLFWPRCHVHISAIIPVDFLPCTTQFLHEIMLSQSNFPTCLFILWLATRHFSNAFLAPQHSLIHFLGRAVVQTDLPATRVSMVRASECQYIMPLESDSNSTHAPKCDRGKGGEEETSVRSRSPKACVDL